MPIAPPRLFPFVSVIVPCRNEARYIKTCLESILDNDYPADRFEVLVVDGMSHDGTRELILRAAEGRGNLRLLDNPRRVTPVALNLGIAAARGELIAWMSAHNRYRRDYLRRCAQALVEHGADNAGGGIVTLARGRGPWARAVAAALSHRFGVGNSEFRTAAGSGEPRWVDTVFGGCYRREVFQKVGQFNEDLVRGQDMEFNLRMRRSGCRILLVPQATSDYFARTAPLEFIRHTFVNGMWAVLPFAHTRVMPVSGRHLVPAGFVFALLGSAGLALADPAGKWLLGLIGCAWLAAAVAVSTGTGVRRGDPALVVLLPVALALLHLSYGLGSLWGVLRLPVRWARGRRRAFQPAPLS